MIVFRDMCPFCKKTTERRYVSMKNACNELMLPVRCERAIAIDGNIELSVYGGICDECDKRIFGGKHEKDKGERLSDY